MKFSYWPNPEINFFREKSGDKGGSRSRHDRGEQYRSLQPERAEFKPENHGEHSVKKPSSNIGITSTKSDIKDGYEPVVSTETKRYYLHLSFYWKKAEKNGLRVAREKQIDRECKQQHNSQTYDACHTQSAMVLVLP